MPDDAVLRLPALRQAARKRILVVGKSKESKHDNRPDCETRLLDLLEEQAA